MKIGIIGVGFVGGATAEVLKKVHDLYLYDKYKEPYNTGKNLEELAANSEAVFVCVPTPMQRTGAIDYSAIHNSIAQLLGATYKSSRKPEDILIIIRSTAISGSTDELASIYPFKFAFNPEFLREKYAVEDMQNTTRVIIGVEDKETTEKIISIYKPLFPNAEYRVRNRKTAEMDKYGNNFMLSWQVLGANLLHAICQKVGVNYQELKEDLSLDPRIGKTLEVPGHDGFKGYGGKCFPKDNKAIIHLAKTLGVDEQTIKLLEEAFKYNLYLRGEEGMDWLNIPGAVSENKDFKTK